MSNDRLNKLEIANARMEEKIDNLSEGFVDLKKTLQVYVDNAEKSFARKWVETIASALLIVFVIFVAGLAWDMLTKPNITNDEIRQMVVSAMSNDKTVEEVINNKINNSKLEAYEEIQTSSKK